MLPKKRKFDYTAFEDMRCDTEPLEPLDLTVGEKRAREPSNNDANNVSQNLNPSPGPSHSLWEIPITPQGPVYTAQEEQSSQPRCREICKMPMNAFMMFSKKHRAIAREKYPGQSNRELSKILSDCWYCLRPEQRHHYNEFAFELKIAYHDYCQSILRLENNENEAQDLSTRPGVSNLRDSSARKDIGRISILEMGNFQEKFSALPVFDISPGKRDGSQGLAGSALKSEEINLGRGEGSAKAPDIAPRKKLQSQRVQLILQLFQQSGFFPSEESVAEFQTRHAHLFRKKSGLLAQIRVTRQKLMARKSPSPTE